MTDPEKMRLVMKSLNMTQKELAHAAGLTQSLISDVVTGKRKATYHIINKIGQATGLNQDWWFNQRGSIFLDKEASFVKPIEVSKDDLIKILAEQNETLKARIKDQQRIIELMEQRIPTDKPRTKTIKNGITEKTKTANRRHSGRSAK